eukprot:926351-Prymnesium_polylepis.2
MSRGYIVRTSSRRQHSSEDARPGEGSAPRGGTGTLTLPPFIDDLVRKFGLNSFNLMAPAATRLQAGVRGRIARQRS